MTGRHFCFENSSFFGGFKVRKVLIIFCISLSPILSARADIPAAEEWVDIPVVVNIIDASDASNVDAIIKRANEILKQAHIRLVVKKTNKNVNVGDGDGDLTEDEGNTAQKEGQKELDKVCGAGKGIKITIADDVWVEEPNTTGWAVHRNPVIFVEPDTDPNARGRTAAHETCHIFTLYDTFDINDINDLMYGYAGGGTTLGPNDVNEIFDNAKKRGKPYFVMPRVPPGGAVAIPCGVDFSIDSHGAILDDFSDLTIDDPYGIITGPDDQSIQYADVREVILFGDEPFDPNSTITLEIQLGGATPDFPADSFFDVFFDLDPANPDFEGMILIDIGSTVIIDNIGGMVIPKARWLDLLTGTYVELPPPIIHENQKFDIGDPDVIVSRSVHVNIPTELVSMSLVSTHPITVQVNSATNDYREPSLPELPIWLDDYTEPFEFGLTQPCTCPGIKFSSIPVADTEPTNPPSIAVWGCGFTGDVGIELDGQSIGMADADVDGKFTYVIDTTLELQAGVHSVIAKEFDDSGPTGANYAIGYFNHCPEGEAVGDLDGDCDVDFYDFAIIANNWLKGTIL